MYEGLINNLRKAADKWEREHPIIGVGQLRVHDALRYAARALKEADYIIEQVTLERDAAVKDLQTVCNMMNICRMCKDADEGSERCEGCLMSSNWQWRGVTKEE